MRTLSVVLLSLAFALPSFAQDSTSAAPTSLTFEELIRHRPNAVKATIPAPKTPVYSRPRAGTTILMRLDAGTEVVAYEQYGRFHAIARTGDGHIGYVRTRHLRIEKVQQ